jgi:predicted peptidase
MKRKGKLLLSIMSICVLLSSLYACSDKNSLDEDEEFQGILAEVEDKYEQLEFKDKQTGKTLSYNLYIPENYNPNEKYPLILFMPDLRVEKQKTTSDALGLGYGGVIWATEEEQEKHPSFVLVPKYSEKIANDDFETTDEAEMTVRLLESIKNQYSVDENRLYATGQSMGCMTAMYLNTKYPDLFAASLFVSGQWDVSEMDEFANEKFFYIVAEGDKKASTGMEELKQVLEENGANISSAVWDATWSADEFDTAVQTMLSEGNSINLVKFKSGTVLPEGETEGANEHMSSFDYAYKIEGVRDWLFEQVKE